MNYIVVESENDKAFLEALIKKTEVKNIEISPILTDNEYIVKQIGGVDSDETIPTKLIKELTAIKDEIPKKPISKIGILLDIDDKGEEKRLSMVNNALNKVFPSKKIILNNTNEAHIFNFDKYTEVSIFCCFTNVKGKGELEPLLRVIAKNDSPYADCLNDWRDCVKKKGKIISDKDFTKFWIANYIRWDTCNSKEKKRANSKCNSWKLSYILEKKDIFKLNAPELNFLYDFLKLFK